MGLVDDHLVLEEDREIWARSRHLGLGLGLVELCRAYRLYLCSAGNDRWQQESEICLEPDGVFRLWSTMLVKSRVV